MAMLDNALALAQRGFYVFPLIRGEKTPAIKRYPEQATRDTEQINAWWFDSVLGVSRDHNIGIYAGRYGDGLALLVVDVDTKNGADGEATLARLEGEESYVFPPTLEARTPTGGRHLFYVVDSPLNQRKPGALGRGLDLRSRGGYVVAAGSVTEKGAYVWGKECEPARLAPDHALVKFCGEYVDHAKSDLPPVETDPEQAEKDAIIFLRNREPVYQGRRNDDCKDVALWMHDRGLSAEAVPSLLLEHWQCFPMLDPGEIGKTVNSAYRSCKSRQGCAAPEAAFVPLPPIEEALSGLERFALNGASREMETKMLEDVFVLGKLAILGQATILYARPNAGKTLATIRLLTDSIEAGQIDPNGVYYINADDTYRGLIKKLKIAERYKFKMLAPGHMYFAVKDLGPIIEGMAKNGQTRGKILIFDTAKKFTDLMDKKIQRKFGILIREFVATGGTAILLAHVNKNPGQDGRLIYAGTSDLVEDLDCAYVIDVLKDDGATKTIEFRNEKNRGDVELRAAYQYQCAPSVPWEEKLSSFERVHLSEADALREETEKDERKKADAPIIEAIKRAIVTGAGSGKTELINAARAFCEAPRSKIERTLANYQGEYWRLELTGRNTHRYVLIDNPISGAMSYSYPIEQPFPA